MTNRTSVTSRTARFAWIAITVITVGVIALVVYALTGPATPTRSVRRVATAGDVVSAVTAVPPAVFDTVGATAAGVQLQPPKVLRGQAPLEARSEPEVLYVGAEYCPFCAAERWPLIVALARFGHFTTLRNMQSAPTSVFPSIQTFTFVGTGYTSRYLAFRPVELYSDAADAEGAYTRIADLDPADAALVTRDGSGLGNGIPFVDIANRMVASAAAFSPALLVHQSQAAIAGSLAQAGQTQTGPAQAGAQGQAGQQNQDGQSTPSMGAAIVAAANELTAGICSVTGQRPGSVCGTRGVRLAASALALP